VWKVDRALSSTSGCHPNYESVSANHGARKQYAIKNGAISRKVAGSSKAHLKKMKKEGEQLIASRPSWTKQMTRNQLDEQERHAFLEWRRDLAV